MAQFAMVEELASLVRDNLVSKHLVLSMEEAFMNFLEDHSNCPDGVFELEPMDPYNRLLLHRLAEIFGFAHVSVGEGDDRHLILERCPETSIPSILVSDFLFQHDEPQLLSPSYQLLRREDAPSVLQVKSFSHHTLEDREAAYLAARERIFSLDITEGREHVRQKPRTDPVVARRMIAHALGQRNSLQNQNVSARDCNGDELQLNNLTIQDKAEIDSNSCLETHQGTISVRGKNGNLSSKATSNNHNSPSRIGVKKDSPKEEQMGAAKRLFAHALGRNPARSNSVQEAVKLSKLVSES